jgi:hypothetical protein
MFYPIGQSEGARAEVEGQWPFIIDPARSFSR